MIHSKLLTHSQQLAINSLLNLKHKGLVRNLVRIIELHFETTNDWQTNAIDHRAWCRLNCPRARDEAVLIAYV